MAQIQNPPFLPNGSGRGVWVKILMVQRIFPLPPAFGKEKSGENAKKCISPLCFYILLLVKAVGVVVRLAKLAPYVGVRLTIKEVTEEIIHLLSASGSIGCSES